MIQNITKASEFLLKNISVKPEVGIILGSGLGGLGDKIDISESYDYDKIPNFPTSTVEGHGGKLIFGKLGGKSIVAMQGRFHYYEGYSMQELTLPVRVMKLLGAETLIVSNAAGGLNPEFNQGDIMIINDHINFFGDNPLRGKNMEEFGTRFPDMSKVYNAELINIAEEAGKAYNIKLRQGVYCGSQGPTLETPAEYKMFRLLGADSTGMSTVPEVIVAHHQGMRVFGLSIITNTDEPVDPEGETTHDEVQDVAGIAEPKMTKIITHLLKHM
ncbi:MAG: purine-nucleoside phosphorylase [Bacteroidota bacterium]|nr:purine-nucleoside phosphorylase [Bacteroidota bacterium]